VSRAIELTGRQTHAAAPWPESFAGIRWIDNFIVRRRPGAGQPSAITGGRAVYQQRCEICHFNASEAKKIGPGLKGIYKRGKFADGRRVDDASMERWIVEGGKDMPPFKGVLNPSQIRDLLSYLKTL
jgi:cytochrome c